MIDPTVRLAGRVARVVPAHGLAERGVVLAQIANAGRWSSADTALRYARRARRWDDTPLRALIY